VAPDSFHDFFVASAGVAGALIGLLFVAISVAPERLLSADAEQAHRIRASAALISFTNALAVALFALVPEIDVGWTAAIVSVIGLLFVGGSLLSIYRVRATEPTAFRDTSFLIGLTIVFAIQFAEGARLIGDHGHNDDAVGGIAVLVIVCFLIGISRSWELIGGPQIGLGSELRRTIRERDRDEDDEG